MIDWLEEVLRAAGSGEEQSLLPELLGQGGTVLPARDAAAPEVMMSLAGQSGDPLLLPQQGAGNEGTFPSAEKVWQGERSVINSLYRRTVEALREHRTVERSGAPVTLPEGQAVNAGLTARELDRAVRRDSRRYDGGMNIY